MPQKKAEEEVDPQVNQLETQALAIQSDIASLVSQVNPPNTTDQNQYMQILKGILIKSVEGKKILQAIKTWLVTYRQLTEPEQQLLVQQFQTFDQLDKTKLVTKKEQDEEEEATTTKPKEEIKHKEELFYFGGFVLLLAVVAMLFKK